MYQNIFVKTTTNEAWVWDDKKGLTHFNYTPYAYKKDPNGKYQSLHGDKLSRVTSFVKNDPNLFESDVPETTRILVDMYGDSDMPSEGIVTMAFDIEVEMITGTPDPQLGNNEVTSIAYHDSATSEYTVLILDKRKRVESKTIGNRHIVSCQNEKDLLLKFIDAIHTIRPHVMTGWNCVDEREWVSTKTGLVRLKDIGVNDETSYHGLILNKWNSEKKANNLTLKNGRSILISDEHRIPVMSKLKGKYTYPNPLLKSVTDRTVSEIRDMMETHEVYCKIPLVRNGKNKQDTYNLDALKLIGFIYTDGTYSNENRITITGTNYKSMEYYANLINHNKFAKNEVSLRTLSKRKEHHNQEWSIRYTPSESFRTYLGMIYNSDGGKELSLDSLSNLSESEFSSFVSGLVDGDGSITSGKRGLSICQSPIESRNNLYDLFTYFGLATNITKNGVYIPAKNINRWLFSLLSVTHSSRKEKLEQLIFHEDKNTPRKLLNEFCMDDCRVVKISSIEETEQIIPMIDIQTEEHYFTVAGMNVHNCDAFDVPYLYNRIKRVLGKKVANQLSTIGEMYYSPYRNRYSIAGTSMLDYMVVYKKFFYGELPSYALNAISMKELGRGKIEYEGNLDALMENDIETFIEYNITDVELILELDKKLQYIDLLRAICHVGHVPYEDFVYSSKYLEGALLTYLKRAGGIVSPNKPADGKDRMRELKESGETGFIGAFVKDPIPGKYEWMYDLDLTSLYPSIIMTLNISPETKMGKILDWDADEYIRGEKDEYIINGERVSREKLQKFLEKYKYTVAPNGVMYTTDFVGLIPSILNEWFDKRVEYKDEMKKWGKAGDNDKYEFYKKRQLVQKILLNSLYGVLGLPSWRYANVDNAEATTMAGQTIIKKTEAAINMKYNKELGYQIEVIMEDDSKRIYYENNTIPVLRDGIFTTIKGSELLETDEIIDNTQSLI
jgi:DNA polymerase elongation subunit (family B)